MTNTTNKSLLTIHERTFLQMLEGGGTVDVRIERLDRYFVPFVYFTPNGARECVPHGAIMRGATRQDRFAARPATGRRPHHALIHGR